ncbi:MAG: 2-methylcitrate synthase [SAR324 cluster bacterium]|nr:2-methylcitrate synthase [SAR324 cluster bacterium]
MKDKKTIGAGLRGVVAGQTAICTCGINGSGLTYRGYDINDLAKFSSFEEVSFLLMCGKLPTKHELANFTQDIVKYRKLPAQLKELLENMPKDSNPMDVLRTGGSFLGVIEPETSFTEELEKAKRLLGAFPSMLGYWYNYANHQKRIDETKGGDSVASYLLTTLTNQQVSDENQRCMDVSLILYAEHEFNASTFVCRVCAATLSDYFSAIIGGIGTLRGPLHGGANEAAMELISRFKTPAEASQKVKQALVEKEKIMGFGHAVYSKSDPRNLVIKEWAKKLSLKHSDSNLFAISESIEKLMWDEKKLFPNLDFYSATAYHFMGISTELFTPLFVISRTSGWSSHIFEQRKNNRLIRPNAEYIGPEPTSYTPINER